MGDFRMFDTSCYLLNETLLDPWLVFVGGLVCVSCPLFVGGLGLGLGISVKEVTGCNEPVHYGEGWGQGESWP